MKITGYNASVNPNVANARVQNVGDMMAYGGNGSGLQAISKAIGQVNAQYQKIAEEEDKRMLMSAMDTYNKGRYDILYNDENGVMNTKLAGASNSVATYQEREAKLRNDIMGNLKFKTKQYQNVFADMVNKSAQQGFQLVDRHQYQEGEKQKDVTFNNLLDNELMMLQKNYNNDAMIKSSIAQIQMLVDGNYHNRGEEFVKSVTNKAVARLGKSVIEEAIMRGEYDVAEKNLKFFDAVFTPEMRDSLEKSLFTKGKNDYIMNLAESLVNQYGEDIGGMVEVLNGTNAFGTDRLMNLAERQTVLNLAQSIVNTNKAIEKARDNQLTEDVNKILVDMKLNAKNSTDMRKWASEQYGNDATTYLKVNNIIDDFCKTWNKRGMEKIEILRAEEMLANGQFNSQQEYLGYLAREGANETQYFEGAQAFKDFQLNQGKFSVKLDNYKDKAMGKSNLSDSEKALWLGMKTAVADQIAAYKIENKTNVVPDSVVYEMLDKAKTKAVAINYEDYGTWLNTSEVATISPAQFAIAGIKSVKPLKEYGNDWWQVTQLDGKVYNAIGDTIYRNVEAALEVTK